MPTRKKSKKTVTIKTVTIKTVTIEMVLDTDDLSAEQQKKIARLLSKSDQSEHNINCVLSLSCKENILYKIVEFRYTKILAVLMGHLDKLVNFMKSRCNMSELFEKALVADIPEKMMRELWRLATICVDNKQEVLLLQSLKGIKASNLCTKIFKNGYLSILNSLIECGSNNELKVIEEINPSLLNEAIQAGHEYIVQKALNFLKAENQLDCDKLVSFLKLAEQREKETDDELDTNPRLYINTTNIIRIFIIAEKLELGVEIEEICKLINKLDNYAINKWRNYNNHNLLYLAVNVGNQAIVENLIVRGSNVSSFPDVDSKTPLGLALEKKYINIVSSLMEAGASLSDSESGQHESLFNARAFSNEWGQCTSFAMKCSFPKNGIVRIYNQFPYRYPSGMLGLIRDLPRIAALKANVVWVNPIQMVSSILKDDGNRGSLYAMDNTEKFNRCFFKNIPNHTARIDLVKLFTCTARSLGLLPIFDLVLNHVGKETLLEGLMAQENLLTGSKWEKDTSGLSYLTEQDEDKIIALLWAPYLEQYIKLGFVGVRVDAITNVSFRLQKKIYDLLKSLCFKYHQTEPIIVGELMTKTLDDELISKLKLPGYTHVFVASSFYHNLIYGFDSDKKYSNDGNYGTVESLLIKDAIGYQRDIIFSNENSLGGSIGMSGNHDLGTFSVSTSLNLEAKFGRDLHNAIRKTSEIAGGISEKVLLKAMKERLFCIAFLCPGGWYLLAGDEFGLTEPARVFKNNIYNRISVGPESKWDAKFDISQHIRYINTLLELMPKTSKDNWVNYFQTEIDSHLLRMVVRAENSSVVPVIVCFYPAKSNFDLQKRILEQVSQNYGALKYSAVYLIDEVDLYSCTPSQEKFESFNLPVISIAEASLYITFAKMVALTSASQDMKQSQEEACVKEIKSIFDNVLRSSPESYGAFFQFFLERVFTFLCKYDSIPLVLFVIESVFCGEQKIDDWFLIKQKLFLPLITHKFECLKALTMEEDGNSKLMEEGIHYFLEFYKSLTLLNLEEESEFINTNVQEKLKEFPSSALSYWQEQVLCLKGGQKDRENFSL